ncbi:hypothetical protein RI844_15320 [Thalassotalea fonticola]|uniref:Uncharacterized protein n=1 Tax=Thalassotalea fonticola TaxID=3065649 RepID=A0ABZ0GMG1_9GAMM|nr:hypothetical protein RI844_15320 [Colwelliaceae bacterium S1-1]
MMNKPINITNDERVTEFNHSNVYVNATTVKVRQDSNISANHAELNTSDSEINCCYELGYN